MDVGTGVDVGTEVSVGAAVEDVFASTLASRFAAAADDGVADGLDADASIAAPKMPEQRTKTTLSTIAKVLYDFTGEGCTATACRPKPAMSLAVEAELAVVRTNSGRR
ncbi:MAG TPA: hypothetical protein VGJ28_04450 [Micromonosporaceae bacterium]